MLRSDRHQRVSRQHQWPTLLQPHGVITKYSVVHSHGRWAWSFSLNPPSPPAPLSVCGPLSSTGGCATLQMKLPARPSGALQYGGRRRLCRRRGLRLRRHLRSPRTNLRCGSTLTGCGLLLISVISVAGVCVCQSLTAPATPTAPPDLAPRDST